MSIDGGWWSISCSAWRVLYLLLCDNEQPPTNIHNCFSRKESEAPPFFAFGLFPYFPSLYFIYFFSLVTSAAVFRDDDSPDFFCRCKNAVL